MSNTNKMLIDASHPEETRVVVLRNGRVEEFDYESAARKLLRGNIYLAKVTRVEPALQAAFVDYGGNRHGFLAFNEIHPDYYQIPVADRQALLDEEAAIEAEEEAEVDARAERMAKRRGGKSRRGGARRRSGQSANKTAEGDDEPIFELEADDDVDTTPTHDTSDNDTKAEAVIDADADDVEPTQTADATDDAANDDSTPADAHGTDDDPVASADIGDEASDQDGTDDKPPRTIAQSTEKDPSLSAEPGDLGNVTEHNAEAAQASGADADPDIANLFLQEPEQPEETQSDTTQPEASEAAEPDHAADTQTDPESPSDIEAREPEEDDETNDDGDSDDSNGDDDSDSEGDDDAPEEVDTEGDAYEEAAARPRRSRRSYKIQEVIKRRQVLLIQVVKEERGNKGAALTTYLSLAGRYTVLMPNTARGGGISRKITNPQDRKRLKAIANELEVPEGMGLIIRTAGAARTGQEIRRDFEYLLRLWENVRELTLESTAPSLVYEEGNLIKRSIRDLYNKDVEEVVVSGAHAHREAHDFMSMLMPSHAKNVINYKEPEPLFTRYQIEKQLNAMFSPQVTLKSGGYLVINQTEALVAVDVNSGRSTREFSIEETALHTNLEAAEELARQLKLRDLAGLIVVDFIDMEEKRNNRNVERKLKDALRHDRARIQVGRISHFGLLEMSRQRMRTGVLEGSTTQCVHCQGTGIIRSTESIALAVLRGLEDAVMGRQRGSLTATTTATVALYILNNKREFIVDMEARYGYPITVEASDKMVGANFAIERGPATAAAIHTTRRSDRNAVNMDWGFGDDEAGDKSEPAAEAASSDRSAQSDDGAENENGRKRRRRRRGGRGRASEDANRMDNEASDGDTFDASTAQTAETPDGERADASPSGADGEDDDGENGQSRSRRGRRRGRRGGRRNRERMAQREDGMSDDDATADSEADNAEPSADAASSPAAPDESPPGFGPQPSISASVIEITTPGSDVGTTTTEAGAEEPEEKPKKRRTRTTRRTPQKEAQADVETTASSGDEPPAPTNSPEAEAPSAQSAPLVANASTDADADQGNDTVSSRKKRTQPKIDKPRIERVTVGQNGSDTPADDTSDTGETAAPASATDETDPQATPKRGWWQRRILG